MSSDTTTAVSLLAKLTAGEISSLEIVRQLLDRSDRLKRLNVFVHLDPERVLAQARALDARRQAGEMVGRLAGDSGGDQGCALRGGRADNVREPYAARVSPTV